MFPWLRPHFMGWGPECVSLKKNNFTKYNFEHACSYHANGRMSLRQSLVCSNHPSPPRLPSVELHFP